MEIQKGGKDYMTIISLLIIDGLMLCRKGRYHVGYKFAVSFEGSGKQSISKAARAVVYHTAGPESEHQ